MMRKLVLAVAMVAALPVAAHAAGDAEAGKTVFNKCKACHQIGPGAKNAVGPELNATVGRAAGSVEGYNYSDALKSSGITWDEANLKEWLTNPKAKIAGTKMIFMGLKDPADIDNIIAYLASQTGE